MTAKQTMADLEQQYFAFRRRHIEKRTLASERTSVGKLVRFWDATRRVPKSLDDNAMEDFLYGPDGLAERVPHPPSFNTQLAHLRKFVTWLIRRAGLSSTLLDVMRPLPTAQREYLRISMVQMHNAIETCDDEWERWVLTLASQTLGRDSELRNVRLSDFNLTNHKLRWYRFKTKQFDELPITETLADGLRRWTLYLQDKLGRPAQPYWYAIPHRKMFFNGRTREWVYWTDHQRVNDLASVAQEHVARVAGLAVADLKGQGVHIVRRSMARALYEKLRVEGIPDPIRVVMAMLGHANQATTEKYIGLKADRERRNDLLAGSRLLSVETSNVVQLGVDNGGSRAV